MDEGRNIKNIALKKPPILGVPSIDTNNKNKNPIKNEAIKIKEKFTNEILGSNKKFILISTNKLI